MTPNTIRRHAEAEALRIAYEREDDGADIRRMAAALIHTAMTRSPSSWFGKLPSSHLRRVPRGTPIIEATA